MEWVLGPTPRGPHKQANVCGPCFADRGETGKGVGAMGAQLGCSSDTVEKLLEAEAYVGSPLGAYFSSSLRNSSSQLSRQYQDLLWAGPYSGY